MVLVDESASPTIFLIDFGLAHLFRNPATYLHIPYSTNHSLVGTLPFTPINCQRGNAQSRRDDLESLAYTIIYSARGGLPWGRMPRWAILAPVKSAEEALGQAATQAPQPMQAAASIARSAVSLPMRWVLPSTAFPVDTEM